MDEAERIRAEADAYADAARRRADAFAEARIRRLRELSDRLIATAETVDRRFGEALALKEQLDDLAAALARRRAARRARAGQRGAGRPARPAAAGVQVQDVRGTSPDRPLS